MTHNTDETRGKYDTEAEVAEAMEMLGKGYNNDPIPETKFVSTMSGFTPCPDVLALEFGPVTALVFGRVWRYCQMQDGVCRAAISKIAESVGMSERTIIRHLEQLCDGGYLFDTTPSLRNKPHIYADTGKIKIKVSVEAGVTESHSTMTESQRQGDRKSVEESIKKQVKKPKIKEAATPKPPTPDEVKLFREVKGRYPNRATYELVQEKIQQVSKRLLRHATKDDLRPFYVAWTSKGYNPENLAWLDWAISGIVPQNGKVAGIQEPKAFGAIRSWLNSQQEEVINVNAE